MMEIETDLTTSTNVHTCFYRDSTVFVFYINQSSVHFKFSPNMACFPDILNYVRHNGFFGTGKTPNFRAQRHGDNCFSPYKRK